MASSMQTTPDIAVRIVVPSDQSSETLLLSSERRISPAWSIEQLKRKLEPVTGIPPHFQRLQTRDQSGRKIPIDDDRNLVGDRRYGLKRDSEIEVVDTRPPTARQNFTDVSSVEKYEMPEAQYEQLSDTVLAWKKRQKLGRFDPNARSLHELSEDRKSKDEMEIRRKAITLGRRCRIGTDDTRRGAVRFIGPVEGLGGDKEAGCRWIGVELDEPLGRNDGSVEVGIDENKHQVRRLFECKPNFGVLIRAEKVEVGDWPPLDDLLADEDMEEI